VKSISKIRSSTREGKERKEKEKERKDKQQQRATAGTNKEPKARRIDPSGSKRNRKKGKKETD
jgi:hypothetical protein